ncbi:MAG: hypothetical protein DDT28_01242 [Dehalococcoidia bacterium]|nr:hypothetical protein [Chloroflexota bacterium]
MSYKHLLKQEAQLRQEVEELLALSEQADQVELPDELVIENEITFRKNRLANLAKAKAVMEVRAQERYEAELAEYEAKVRAREEKARQAGRKPRGRISQPPTSGPRDKDQYNFTDPESCIMKNSNNQGFDQHYNVQVAVDHFLIVVNTLSSHPNDQGELEPTLDAIPAELGTPGAVALDNGYFSAGNITACETRGIDPYIATGREPHHRGWKAYFAELPAPPPEDASPKEKMAYKLQTEIGKAIYRLRKCTVEPVIGIIKEILGFRQFSLRGSAAAAGEWCLVCLAFNLKRLHVLLATS